MLLKKIKFILKEYFGLWRLANYLHYRKVKDIRALPIEKRVDLMLEKYEKVVGYKMDINHPKTFTEKMQWYKAYYTGDGHLDRVVDKFLFKGYIEEKLGKGYTIPLYGVWEDIKSLEKDWDSLPNEFCLKSNVQSGGKWIEFIHNKSAVNFKNKKRIWRNWFLYKYTLINGMTQAYRNCKPRIIAEQYLENIKDQLFDYKFFCFNGEPFCCCVNTQHFEKGKEDTFPITYYDMNWNKLSVQSGVHETEESKKPKHYDQMVELSRILFKDFPHIRVDFFDTEEKLYISELTLYSGGGYFKYKPETFNEEMGELFQLPI